MGLDRRRRGGVVLAQDQKIFLSRLEPDFAAALLLGMESRDPRGTMTAADLLPMAQASDCFAATAENSQAVYVVQVRNGVAWIAATKGNGLANWTALLLPIIEAQSAGLARVAFQTERAGLKRAAEKQGYTVAGWIMKKELPQ